VVCDIEIALLNECTNTVNLHNDAE
jgi:hypothetical protein